MKYEDEYEDEFEAEFEAESGGILTANEAEAEYMADRAAKTKSTSEATTMAGAAAVAALSPSDRVALRNVLPHMVRGTHVLAQILRKQPATRPAVRTVPTIVKRTAKVLRRQAVSGRPVSRKTAARVMANQTKKVLSSPRTCAGAMTKNLRAKQAIARRKRQIRG